MIVQQLRGRGQGLFKVTLASPIKDVAHKATFTGQVEDIEIPITAQPEPSSGYRGQKTGTRYICGCVVWSINHSQNDNFDKAMATPEPQGYKYPQWQPLLCGRHKGKNYTRVHHGPEPCYSTKGHGPPSVQGPGLVL